MDGSFKLTLSDEDDDASQIFDSKSNLDDMFSEFMEDAGTSHTQSVSKPQADVSSSAATSSTSSATTVLAKVVYAYKLINGENIAQGRIGLAVVQQSADTRHLILYRTRTEVLATLTLPATTIQPKGEYLQFRDDVQHLWSVCFDVAADRTDFLRTIGPELTSQLSDRQAGTTPPREGTAKGNVTKVVSVDAEPVKLATGTSKRALVNRMAKMGHQLPQLPVAITAVPDPSASSADSSDSESLPPTATRATSTSSAAAKWKPLVAQRPSFPASLLAAAAATTNNTLIAYTSTTQPTGLVSQTGCLQQQQQQQFSDSSAAMNAHFAETRMQNTELRMNLAKMDARLERVLDRIDSVGLASRATLPPTPRSDREAELIGLEERVLGLRKENRELRIRGEEQAGAEERRRQLEQEQWHERLAASERAVRQKDDELEALHVQLNVAEETAQKQRLEIAELQKERQSPEDRSGSGSAVEPAAVNAAVKMVLSQFYQQLQAALEESSSGEDLRAEQVLKLARVLIKREAQNVLHK